MLRSSAASRLSARLSAIPAARALTTSHIRLLARASNAVPTQLPKHVLVARHFSAEAQRFSPLTKTCPSCASPLPTPLPACPHCFHITRLHPSTNFYDIFGVPPLQNLFDVDVALLKSRFRNLQRVIHPDKWSNRGEGAQDIAAELSSIVNKAYGTLTNPYTRAEYILQQEGVSIGESDNIDDPTLIMEVMEKREELDSAETQEEVDEIRRGNMSQIQQLLPLLSSAVGHNDWTSVREHAIKLKYLQGIDLAAQAWPNQPFDH